MKGTMYANITSTVLYSFSFFAQRSSEVFDRKQTGTRVKKLRDPKNF